MGARVVHITFHEVLGEGSQYRGQWQGGRVTTEGREVRYNFMKKKRGLFIVIDGIDGSGKARKPNY